MAKKKTARKVTPKRGSSRSKKTTGRVKAKSSRSSRPRQKQLPGMEDMHHPKLGPLAEKVAGIRQEQADLRESEEALLPTVLRIMHNEDRSSFYAHGVEFIRKAGAEKLLVKTSAKRGKQTNETTTDVEPEPAAVDA